MKIEGQRLTDEASLQDRLQRVQEKAEAGRYAVALTALKEIKNAGVASIYIDALERQMKRLLTLSERSELTDDAKAHILEPISGIIDLAIGSQNPVGTPALAEPNASFSAHTNEDLDALRTRYFQQAGECLTRGDFDQALTEIRRVYIIDPENTIARRYEAKVEEVKALKGSAPVPPAAVSPGGSLRSASADTRATVLHAENARNEATPASEETHQRRRSKRGLLLGCIAGVPVLLVSAMLLFPHNEAVENSIPLRVAAPAAAKPASIQTQQAAVASGPASVDNQAAAKTAEPITATVPPPDPIPSRSSADRLLSTSTEPTPHRGNSTQELGTIEKSPVLLAFKTSETNRTAGSLPASSNTVGEINSPPEPFLAVQTEPEILQLEKPDFPEVALKYGTSGQVIARVLIDAQGNPSQIKILKSSNEAFTEAVIAAIQNSKFTPGKMSNGPVASWLTIPFNFKIQ
jgi:protein TonB